MLSIYYIYNFGVFWGIFVSHFRKCPKWLKWEKFRQIFCCITKISHKKKVFLQGHRVKMKNQEACKFEFCIKATIF